MTAGALSVAILIRPAAMTYERAMHIAMAADARAHGLEVTADEAAKRWPVKQQVLHGTTSEAERLARRRVMRARRNGTAVTAAPAPAQATRPEGEQRTAPWKYEQRAQDRQAPTPKPNKERTGGKFARGLEAHREELTRLHELGHNDLYIAEQLGVSRKQVGRWRNTLGLPVQPYTRNYNRDLHMVLLESYRLGRTDRQTADLLGMDRQRVGQARIRYGIPCHRAVR